MYTVMLVDDEPAALNYMLMIIQKKCPEFQVIAMANDGKEALKMVGELEPDVLVFDIRMPIVDGLAMSYKIKELGLSVIMVVVSGYSQFDYARTAMQNGAVDYLLKPVVPDDAKRLFDKLKIKVEKKYYERRAMLLRKLYESEEPRENDLTKYFGDQKYYIALARVNGLPERFSKMNGREIFSGPHEKMIAYGRDEKEDLFICPRELLSSRKFEEMIVEHVRKERGDQGYLTILFSENAYDCKEIKAVAGKLYHILDNNVVFLKNQVILLEKYKEKPIIRMLEEEKSAMENFKYYAEKRNISKLQDTIKGLIRTWVNLERPILWVERRIRSLSIIWFDAKESDSDEDYIEREYMLEEIFAESVTLEQLENNVCDLFFQHEEKDHSADEKMDTEIFIEKICNYIKKHLGDDIGAQEIGRKFGVSQTYLGKLFRKYKDTSFNTYLTALRMEKAKEIIIQNPNALIKEIAERLGYNDQFYFSRVFRSYAGMSPSDYMINEKKEN